MEPRASHSAEVVVVGGGLSGICTAIEAARRGAKVLLLERGPVESFGGLALESAGAFFFVDTAEQQARQIGDSSRLAEADWLSAAAFGPDDVWGRRWATLYVNEGVGPTCEFLREHGLSFSTVRMGEASTATVRSNSVSRLHVVSGSGKGLIAALVAELEQHQRRGDVQVLFEHVVTGFQRRGGRIVGCAGHAGRDRVEFVANGAATVVASGGQQGNLDKVRAHWPADWGPPPERLLNGAAPFADGMLFDPLRGEGALLIGLDRICCYPSGVSHWLPRHADHGLVVRAPYVLWLGYDGRRLGPPPPLIGWDNLGIVETICRQPKKYSWQVMNLRLARRRLMIAGSEFELAPPIRNGDVDRLIEHCKDVVTAPSVIELADRMNELCGTKDLVPEVLEDEIRRYDDVVRAGPARWGEDEQTRILGQNASPIDDPRGRPLIAIRESLTTRKGLGGVVTDLECRVLDGQGAPIPGLYAVGEAAGFGGGGAHGRRQLEGTCLGLCVFTGRRAGAALTA